MNRSLLKTIVVVGSLMLSHSIPVETPAQSLLPEAGTLKITVSTEPLVRYFDPQAGMTADQAVAYALAHNGELLAARKEIDAANALVKQAALRANPMLEIGGAKTILGTDNNVMVQGTLPLELGGRRAAR